MKSTVITKQYKQIQLAKEEAELANKTKSRFLSNMSQEIITPINTIMCMDEMLLRENAKDVPKDYLHSVINYSQNIRIASESLLNLINDLLEMTKIESGKMSLTETEYDSKEFLRSVIIPARLKSADKNLKFDFSIDKMIPSRLYGDVGKIKHVLLNLLSNAQKYTNEGGFDLKITMEGRTNDMCDLCVLVKDTGNGMNPEVIETIFDAYGAFEKEAKGFHLKTGLGLDISRRFAELMGGVLVCTSDVGKGSEFIFTLTQKIIDPTPIGTFTETEDVTERTSYTPEFIAPDADVLVASENSVTLNAIESLLKATKVFVTRAQNKQNFIDKIHRSSFNVAFVDHLFFETNEKGIDELISQIKHFAPDLPVYIFTENASSDEDFYKSKGFNGMLSLPFDPVLLEKAIMRHIPKEIMEIPKKVKVGE
jgi:nitrogen-specific signal transduction histidine kinase/CheY-like chemotaxis protein